MSAQAIVAISLFVATAFGAIKIAPYAVALYLVLQ